MCDAGLIRRIAGNICWRGWRGTTDPGWRIAGAAATREPSACIEGTPTTAPSTEGYLPDIRTDIYSSA